jgi:hypothetical protein
VAVQHERAGNEPRVWVFNLDAELELAAAGPYQTPKHVARALEAPLVHARRLMELGDAEIGAEHGRLDRPRIGRAWCPTPSALKRLAHAGAEPEPSPDVEVLRRVNHRRFALELGGGAPGSRYLEAPDELAATLREPNAASWLFKRPFGFAGRGQRRIGRELSADDRRWLDDSLRQGGLMAEPFVDIARELCLHGRIARTGHVELGRLCTQRVDGTRSWAGTELLSETELEQGDGRRLRERAAEVSAALFAAGYFGPFNIDAYLWLDPSGQVRLNSLGEINARYSMGFAVGMGSQ